jgi:DNA topoisomerase-1
VADNLVVVESPAKAKTIEKYLGDGYTVLASYGHIRDLPRSDFAIEVGASPDDVELRYEVPSSSTKHVSALRKAAKGDVRVWLATDLDREGEAIAWHVAEVLGLDVANTPRVVFDEITEPAIRAAFDAPRSLDTDLVDAQQARRAVDRIVGYRLSPVLWRAVSSGISAGRVQSVALRLITDREDEIRAFVPEEYWSFEGSFEGDEPPPIEARLHSVGDLRVVSAKQYAEYTEQSQDRSMVVRSEEEADAIVARAEGLDYRVASVKRTERKRNPGAPFKTSTLQGEASKVGFSARQTMAVAQQLYEGIALGAGEQTGLITYMRTDSLNLSDTALEAINGHVATNFGSDYTIDEPRRFATKSKGAQEAHEAIRPTSIDRTPQAVRRYLTAEQYRLYELIWKRTLATQMAPAVFDRVSADVVGLDAEGESITWRVTGQVEKFDGWLAAYRAVKDEDEYDEDDVVSDALPAIEEGQELVLAEMRPEQSFTAPPPRYSERTLVEALEEFGIGRPSTYASIISTLENREYVRKEGRRFFATPLGEVVVEFLKQHFAEVVDVDFTARMEETLDEIATGDERWGDTVTRFLDTVDEWVRERKPERPRLPLQPPAECHVCGAPMEKVFSGKSKQWFASCSRWPDCDGTLPLDDDGTVGEPEPEPEPDEDVRCPEDGAPMILRDGRFGKFYGCINYGETGKAKCSGIRNIVDQCVHKDDDGQWQPFLSPNDGVSGLQKRKSRYGKWFVGSMGYPEDEFAIWSVPIAQPCPRCGAPCRKPPANRNEPVAICTGLKKEHHWDVPDFDLPFVRTRKIVPGVEKFDPALGGEPLEEPEDYEPFPMEFREERTPKKKKAKKATSRRSSSGKG